MKILYGIQGTGNGHISRGRMMAKHFAERDVDVNYLFTGRDPDKFFDMDIFGDYSYRRGLTFVSENGKVSYIKTAVGNSLLEFARDVRSLDLSGYDLVMTDFEPVTAWAARRASVKTLGVGHQYAFGHDVPRAGENPIANLTMKMFAPTEKSLGLHWNAFNSAILPPIIDNTLSRWQDKTCENTKIVVYLPFENQQWVQSLLKPLSHCSFYIYSPDLENEDRGHLHLRRTSHEGFKRDLTSAQGVISNSGFELISECLHLGLQILTKPQAGQMEQQSNAAALEQLGYATTVKTLDSETIKNWLEALDARQPILYPDVAADIVDWIMGGQIETAQSLSDHLWDKTRNSEHPPN